MKTEQVGQGVQMKNNELKLKTINVETERIVKATLTREIVEDLKNYKDAFDKLMNEEILKLDLKNKRAKLRKKLNKIKNEIFKLQ